MTMPENFSMRRPLGSPDPLRLRSSPGIVQSYILTSLTGSNARLESYFRDDIFKTIFFNYKYHTFFPRTYVYSNLI